jgi:hypothetical protein
MSSALECHNARKVFYVKREMTNGSILSRLIARLIPFSQHLCGLILYYDTQVRLSYSDRYTMPAPHHYAFYDSLTAIGELLAQIVPPSVTIAAELDNHCQAREVPVWNLTYPNHAS